MVWYVALIAILNLGLGYLLAVYLGVGRPQLAATAVEPLDDPDYSDTDVDE